VHTNGNQPDDRIDDASVRQPRWLLPGALAVCAAGVVVGVLLAAGFLTDRGDRPSGAGVLPTVDVGGSEAAAAPATRTEGASASASPRPAPGQPVPARTSDAPSRSVGLPPGVRLLRSVVSSRCLGVPGRQDGADAALLPCAHPTASQQWRSQPVRAGVVRLVNVASSRCLEVDGLSRSDNATIQQRTCDGAPNQLWQVREVGNGRFVLTARHSGKCLQASKSGVGQADCDGGDSQRWTTG